MAFPKEKRKGIVAVVTDTRKRMKTEKVLIIVNWRQITRIFTEIMILRKFVTERERKKS
jgi:hypothetical protein